MEDNFPWLQVNLQDDVVITQVATQGFGGSLRQWVKSYKLTFVDDRRVWRDYYVPRKVGSKWRIKVRYQLYVLADKLVFFNVFII